MVNSCRPDPMSYHRLGPRRRIQAFREWNPLFAEAKRRSRSLNPYPP